MHFSAPGHLLQSFGVTIRLNRDFRSGSVDFKQNLAAMLTRARSSVLFAQSLPRHCRIRYSATA
jgi:hypothetical protein